MGVVGAGLGSTIAAAAAAVAGGGDGGGEGYGEGPAGDVVRVRVVTRMEREAGSRGRWREACRGRRASSPLLRWGWAARAAF